MNQAKTILVVDDEHDVLVYLSTLFEDHGFDVITAGDGIEALKKAKTAMPDLITLDLTMPGQSGIKTYFYLKKDPLLQHIPVIIITAVGDHIKNLAKKFEQCQEPEAFISKPMDQIELIEAVNKLFS